MSPSDVKGEVHLRPYQENAVRRVDECVAQGMRRLLVVAPTGSGKSVIIGRLIVDAVRRGERVLIIAHRRELIFQLYAKVVEAGVPERLVGVLMSSDARRRPAAPVQVASIDTLRYRAKPPAELVVRDEAHRALAKTDRDIAALYPNAVHVGFTATPFRADHRGLGEAYDELVVVASMKELIADGFLVQPRVFTVPECSLPDLRRVRLKGGDYDQAELEAAVDQQALVGNLVEHWQKLAGGVRTVAFAVSVNHSKHIAERFRAAGVGAEHLDGSTPTRERDAILARLERGETRVVSSVAVLSEGWDQPGVKCAILARPTKSTGLYLQQAGRILRPWQDTRAVILDHAGCAREHGLPQDDRDYELEPKPKRKRGAVVDVPIRVCDGCQAVLPAATRVCPECGLLFAAPRDMPGELEGHLVEAMPGEATKMPPRPRAPRLDYNRALQRTVFEQLRALARAKRRNAGWAEQCFIERYGAPPPAEWIENAWGAL